MFLCDKIYKVQDLKRTVLRTMLEILLSLLPSVLV